MILQERLDEIKQNPLPYRYQPPGTGWKNHATAGRFGSVTCIRRSPEAHFMSDLPIPDEVAGRLQALRKVGERFCQDKSAPDFETERKRWTGPQVN